MRWLLDRLARLPLGPDTQRALEETVADAMVESADARQPIARLASVARGLAAVARILGAACISLTEGEHPMRNLGDDVRQSWRRVRRTPGFSAVAIGILALGIGVNAAIFSLFNGLMLRDLPVPNLKNLTALAVVDREDPRPRFRVRAEDYRAMAAARVPALASLFTSDSLVAALTGAGQSEVVTGELVSSGYFDGVGVRPIVGRGLLPEDDRGAGTLSVVISERIWRRWFGSRPDVAGQVVKIAGQSLTVVGVLPGTFKGTWLPTMLTADVWVPASASGLLRTVQGTAPRTSHRVFAVMAPGATLAEVDAAVAAFTPTPSTTSTEGQRFRALPGEKAILFDDFAAPGRQIGMAVVGLSALVFLIACANLANLLLARGAARQSEIAIRLVAGASRARIFRLLLTETLVLTSIAAVVSVAITEMITRGLKAIPLPAVQGLRIDFNATPDYRVLAYALIIACVAAIAVGSIPAWRASRTQPVSEIRSGGVGGATRRRSRLQGVLVAAQIACSMVLLLTAGLYARSALKARQFDPGFDLAHGAMVSFDLALHKIDEARGRRVFDRLLDAARAVPGVESAVLMSALPAGGPAGSNAQSTVDLLPEGQSPRVDARGRIGGWYARYVRVTPGAFRTLGLTLTSGRDFTAADDVGAPPVVIVSQELARRFWPGQSPIGHHLVLVKNGPALEIVGVAEDTAADLGATTSANLFAYVPLAQQYDGQAHVIARASVPPASLIAPLTMALRAAEPDVALFDQRTVRDTVRFGSIPLQLAALVLGSLGLVGLAIALLGVYGVVSYVVSQRMREFGIRKALGATVAEIHGVVVRQSLWMLAPGLIVGVVLASVGAVFLRALLYGIGTHDPITFVGVPVALLIVGLAASLIPARRAARVDPNVTLREL